MNKIIFSLLCLSLSFNSFAAEKVQIVASIKPIQLMVQQLVGDLGEVEVLIPEGASPHHYNLKPSDMRKLAQTDLVVWIGPAMEQFLTKTMHRQKSAVIQLMEGEGETEHHEHEEAHKHDDHDDHHKEARHEEDHHDDEKHHHDHGDSDPHIWMDPVLMISAADVIRDELVEQFPNLKSELDSNFAEFEQKVTDVDQSIKLQLAPHKDKGFIVFHDAFSLLVGHYDLNQLAYFTFDPSHAPGAKKVAEVQSLITNKDAVCVFSEPQFEAKIVKRLTAGLDINKGQLDPLAIEVQPEQGYTVFLQSLADKIEHCLK
ncbi:MAG: zinc ABC transporter substrate-binding protein ZnuA [Neptuniibacter sp.]